MNLEPAIYEGRDRRVFPKNEFFFKETDLLISYERETFVFAPYCLPWMRSEAYLSTVVPTRLKRGLLASFVSNCVKKRFEYLSALSEAVGSLSKSHRKVHHFGRCLNNAKELTASGADHPAGGNDPWTQSSGQDRARRGSENLMSDFRAGGPLETYLLSFRRSLESEALGRAGQRQKIETLLPFKFYFAMENNVESCDYVSEKVFAGWAAGAVPVYLGALNVEEYAPSAQSAILLSGGLRRVSLDLGAEVRTLCERCSSCSPDQVLRSGGEKRDNGKDKRSVNSIGEGDGQSSEQLRNETVTDAERDNAGYGGCRCHNSVETGDTPIPQNPRGTDSAVWSCLHRLRGGQYLPSSVKIALSAPDIEAVAAALSVGDSSTPSSWRSSGTDPVLGPRELAGLLLFLDEQDDLYEVYLRWKRPKADGHASLMGRRGVDGTVVAEVDEERSAANGVESSGASPSPLRSSFILNQDARCPYLTRRKPLLQCRVCSAALRGNPSMEDVYFAGKRPGIEEP